MNRQYLNTSGNMNSLGSGSNQYSNTSRGTNSLGSTPRQYPNTSSRNTNSLSHTSQYSNTSRNTNSRGGTSSQYSSTSRGLNNMGGMTSQYSGLQMRHPVSQNMQPFTSNINMQSTQRSTTMRPSQMNVSMRPSQMNVSMRPMMSTMRNTMRPTMRPTSTLTSMGMRPRTMQTMNMNMHSGYPMSRSNMNTGSTRSQMNTGGTRTRMNSGGTRSKMNTGGTRSNMNSGGTRSTMNTGGTRSNMNMGSSRSNPNILGSNMTMTMTGQRFGNTNMNYRSTFQNMGTFNPNQTRMNTGLGMSNSTYQSAKTKTTGLQPTKKEMAKLNMGVRKISLDNTTDSVKKQNQNMDEKKETERTGGQVNDEKALKTAFGSKISSKILQKHLAEYGFFEPIPMRYSSGQGYNEFLKAIEGGKLPPSGKICFIPLENWDKSEMEVLQTAQNFIKQFAGVKVTIECILKPFETRYWGRKKSPTGNDQISAKDIIQTLSGKISKLSSMYIFGVTKQEIVGLSSSTQSVRNVHVVEKSLSVISFAYLEKLKKGNSAEYLRCICILLLRFVLHQVHGIKDCVFYKCLLNELHEDSDKMLRNLASNPMYLCPIDLRKLHSRVSAPMNLIKRYSSLASLYKQLAWKDAKWMRERLACLKAQ